MEKLYVFLKKVNFEKTLTDPVIIGAIFGIFGLFLLTCFCVVKIKNSKTKRHQTAEPPKTPIPSKESPQEAAAPAAPIESGEKIENSEIKELKEVDHASWLSKLQSGLSKTRSSLQKNLSDLFQGNKIDDSTLERLHEVLFRADIGVSTADHLVEHIKTSAPEDGSWENIKKMMREKINEIFLQQDFKAEECAETPKVLLIVGVNGVGKTTSIGKLAAHFIAEDKTVLLCAADTYRAAAIDQLKVWGERLGVKVIAHQQGSDPAAVAYDGVKSAIAKKSDILMVDTAGRLHNKNDLMEELAKINRVIGKDLPNAPHETWLVIDATTGQNAFQQVKAFSNAVKLSGLIVTKLDGTAKGGVIIGISDQFKLPIRYIGVGEKASDLQKFEPKEFVDSLFSTS